MGVIALTAGAQTICHSDGTVTFQYQNDQARDVSVDVQFAGRRAMKRDAQTGLWTVTLGPAAPDMYPYCFVVDGVSVMDPTCDQYFPNEGFKNSLLEIPSSLGPLPHDIQQVQHGMLSYISYYSQTLQATNHAIVYLPPSYMMQPDRHYPVFIQLVPGQADTHESWFKVGAAHAIADRLCAAHHLKPFILTTGSLDFMQQFGQQMDIRTIRASDYNTWHERQEALEKLLTSLNP